MCRTRGPCIMSALHIASPRPPFPPLPQEIVSNIRANNPGRPIPASSVLGLASQGDVNAYLLANPEQTPGAVHFLVDTGTATNINFLLQVRPSPLGQGMEKRIPLGCE